MRIYQDKNVALSFIYILLGAAAGHVLGCEKYEGDRSPFEGTRDLNVEKGHM